MSKSTIIYYAIKVEKALEKIPPMALQMIVSSV